MATLERLLIGLVLWAGSLGAAVWWGMDVGENKVLADAAREERIGRVAYAAANSAAASAIVRIEVKNVYTRQELEREVRTNTVFADCRSGDAAVRLLNATPGIDQSRAVAPGGGVVPASGPAQ